jgi:hypothetical protein
VLADSEQGVQREVGYLIKSVRKNAAVSLNSRWVAGSPAWVKKYGLTVLKVAVLKDGMDLGPQVREAVAADTVSPQALQSSLLAVG